MAKRHSDQLGNLESLFLRLEELVLGNSGEDEFEEIFKLPVFPFAKRGKSIASLLEVLFCFIQFALPSVKQSEVGEPFCLISQQA